ncbi:hypothetical protein SISNIDRAFT_389668, partial [Sistotremastrum niveocremeum HHB9708]
RDVVKADKQDDLAALRLFSAATLRHIIEHQPEELGAIVYAFVCGEICDAWQSRKISHAERCRMIFRGFVFFDEWQKFALKKGYATNKHLPSRQMLDIINTTVHNFIALIIVHRDLLSSGPQPFLPWMHGTEANEHLLGTLRSIIADFNYCDFLYAAKKAQILVQGVYKDGSSTAANAQASGYHHTCHVDEGVPITTHIVFPTDEQIQAEFDAAAEEAESLWEMLG